MKNRNKKRDQEEQNALLESQDSTRRQLIQELESSEDIFN